MFKCLRVQAGKQVKLCSFQQFGFSSTNTAKICFVGGAVQFWDVESTFFKAVQKLLKKIRLEVILPHRNCSLRAADRDVAVLPHQ